MIRLIFLLLLISTSAISAEVFNDQGIKLETAGWIDRNEIPDWTGVMVGLTIPDNGYVVFESIASLELHLPGIGWVKDKGIQIVDGCIPNPMSGRDSRGYKSVVITKEDGCDDDGRVRLVVMIPKIFPTPECKPDEIRWAGGYYRVEE